MTTEITTSKYVNHNFNLTKVQMKNIKKAIKKQEPILIKFTKKSFINGTIPLPLSKAEEMNVKSNKTFHYNLSKKKIELLDKESGFLPILLAGLASLAGLTGAATGIANSVINAKKNQAEIEETQRHNKEIESAAKGEGLDKVVESNGLFLNPYKYDGNGIKQAIDKSKLDCTGKKVLRSFLKNLSDHYKIEVKEGSSLYLNPY
jgi:hypothetical protein